jgi:hypothetical protein
MKKPKNPEVEAINRNADKQVERAEYIESLARKICLDNYQLDPDQLVCQQMPQLVGNLSRYNICWIVPDEHHFVPMWWLFRNDVELILNEINKCPQT